VKLNESCLSTWSLYVMELYTQQNNNLACNNQASVNIVSGYELDDWAIEV
jgi:hypothetical protein